MQCIPVKKIHNVSMRIALKSKDIELLRDGMESNISNMKRSTPSTDSLEEGTSSKSSAE